MYNFTILCGGSGSRLWPQSREKLPKQFLRLTNEYTLFQNTILRIMLTINKIGCSSKINIICNQDHYHLVENQINELHLCTFKTPIIDTFSLGFCEFYSLQYIFLFYYKHLL